MNVGCFLGLEIVQRPNGSISIHQASYTKSILKRFNMENCHSVSTPGDSNQALHKFIDSEQSSKYPYREAVGSLMYLSIATRPDITHAVSIVSRYMENSKIVHVNAVKRIFKYLNETINFGITYSSTMWTPKLIGYSDADHAGDLDTRRSTSGYIFRLNDNLLSWCSERQKSVSISTMEAEYMAASEAVRELIWLVRLLNELLPRDRKERPLFYMDNDQVHKESGVS